MRSRTGRVLALRADAMVTDTREQAGLQRPCYPVHSSKTCQHEGSTRCIRMGQSPHHSETLSHTCPPRPAGAITGSGQGPGTRKCLQETGKRVHEPSTKSLHGNLWQNSPKKNREGLDYSPQVMPTNLRGSQASCSQYP